MFSDVSDGVFRTTELDSVKNAWLNGAAATWVIEHTVDSNFSAARSFKKGHLIPVIEQGASRFEEYGPSNLQMANFRVFEHLATLATRFGIVQQYCDILGEAGVDVATVATESVDASSSDSTENLQ